MDMSPKRRRASDLHKRLIGDIKPFHSHGYAEAAYGNNMGATSSQPYQGRLSTERNRQVVRGYRDSRVVQHRATPQQGEIFHDVFPSNRKIPPTNNVATQRPVASPPPPRRRPPISGI